MIAVSLIKKLLGNMVNTFKESSVSLITDLSGNMVNTFKEFFVSRLTCTLIIGVCSR